MAMLNNQMVDNKPIHDDNNNELWFVIYMVDELHS